MHNFNIALVLVPTLLLLLNCCVGNKNVATTYNFHLKPQQLPQTETKALNQIATELKNSFQDVLCIQGVYSQYQQNYLFNALHKIYPYFNSQYQLKLSDDFDNVKLKLSSQFAPCFAQYQFQRQLYIATLDPAKYVTLAKLRKNTLQLSSCIKRHCATNNTSTIQDLYYCSRHFCPSFAEIIDRECYYCVMQNSAQTTLTSTLASNLCYSNQYNNELTTINNTTVINNADIEFYRHGSLILSRKALFNNRIINFHNSAYFLKGLLSSTILLENNKSIINGLKTTESDDAIFAVELVCTSLSSLVEENNKALYIFDLPPVQQLQIQQLTQIQSLIANPNNTLINITASQLQLKQMRISIKNNIATDKDTEIVPIITSIIMGSFNFGVGNTINPFNSKPKNADTVFPVLANSYLFATKNLTWNNHNSATKFCTYCKSDIIKFNDNQNATESDILQSHAFYADNSNIQVDHIFSLPKNLTNNATVTICKVNIQIIQATLKQLLNLQNASKILTDTYNGVEMAFDLKFCNTTPLLAVPTIEVEEDDDDYLDDALYVFIGTLIVWFLIILLFIFSCCCLGNYSKLIQSKTDTSDGVTFAIHHLNVFPIHSDYQILHDVNIILNPGEMLAIMGPSGCGKSTMLNVMTGNANSYDFNGEIYFNGERVTESLIYSNRCCYVTQNDHFIENLTVYESLLFAAEFQLPSLSRAQRHKRVVEVLDMLKLSHVKDEKVFYSGGLSGGQKRRVLLGMDGLLSNVKLLFLDEVTTGLSSQDALEVISVLRVLASSHNFTIITTIHQPSGQIFSQFNKVLLLKDGHIGYFGPTPAIDVSSYFLSVRTAGRSLVLPKNDNVANAMIDIISQSEQISNSIISHWENSNNAKLVEQQITQTIKSSGTTAKPKIPLLLLVGLVIWNLVSETYTWFKIIAILFVRTSGVLWNNLLFEGVRLILTVWALFLFFPPDPDAEVDTVYNATSYLGSIVIIVLDISLVSGWISFYCDIVAIVKYEIARSRYSIVSHNIVIPCAIAFRSILIAVLTLSVAYWLIGFTRNFTSFFFVMLVRICFDMYLGISNLFLAFITGDKLVALLFTLTIIMINYASMGFYIPEESMSAFTKWLHSVVIQTFMLELLGHKLFSDKEISCQSSNSNNDDEDYNNLVTILQVDDDDCFVSGKQFLESKGLKDRVELDLAVIALNLSLFLLLFFLTTVVYLLLLKLKIKFAYAPSSIAITADKANKAEEIDDDSNDGEFITKAKVTMSSRKPTFMEKRMRGVTLSIGGMGVTNTDHVKKQRKVAKYASNIKFEEDITKSRMQSSRPMSMSNYGTTIVTRRKGDIHVKNFTFAIQRHYYRNKIYSVIPCLRHKIKEDQKVILNNVSIEIKQGEFVAILGPSGSGKTTFLELVAGMRKSNPAATLTGEMLFNNLLVEKKSLAHFRMISFVEQFPLLAAELTVAEILRFAADTQLPQLSYSKRTQVINDVIDIMDISKIINNPIGSEESPSISGGQKRRVAIAAQCLLTPTKYIFMDEPTSGLSALDSKDLLLTLRELVTELQYTIVLTIHQPRTSIFNDFDKIILFAKGELLFSGSPSDADALVASANTNRDNGDDNVIIDDNENNIETNVAASSVVRFASEADTRKPSTGSGALQNTNTAEVLLELASDPSNADFIKNFVVDSKNSKKANFDDETFFAGDSKKHVRGRMRKQTSLAKFLNSKKAKPATVATFFMKLILLFYYRALILWRNKIPICAMYIQGIFVALVIGLIGFQIEKDALNVFSIIGLTVFLEINFASTSAYLMLLTFAQLKRQTSELTRGMYLSSQYYIVAALDGLCLLLPLVIIGSFVFMALVNVTWTVSNIIIFLASMCALVTWIYEYTICNLMIWEDSVQTISAVIYLVTLAILFSGFFVQFSLFSKSIVWLRYFSPIGLCGELIISSEIVGKTYECDKDDQTAYASAIKLTGCPLDGDDFLEEYSFIEPGFIATVFINLILLLFVSGIFVICGFCVIHRRVSASQKILPPPKSAND